MYIAGGLWCERGMIMNAVTMKCAECGRDFDSVDDLHSFCDQCEMDGHGAPYRIYMDGAWVDSKRDLRSALAFAADMMHRGVCHIVNTAI